MNLFFLSRSPSAAAAAHANRHVVKMVLETAQLLSTAHRVSDGERAAGVSQSGRAATLWRLPDCSRDALLYRATHVNHPVAVWIRSSRAHYAYAFELFVELLREYTFRYDKVHACTKLVDALADAPARAPDAGWTDPPTCMPEEFRVSPDPVACYQAYYRVGKADLLQYKRREPPAWLAPPTAVSSPTPPV
jgi:hypothetical protein